MRIVATIAFIMCFVILVSTGATAQTQPFKYAEFESIGGGCEEYDRLSNFMQEIMERRKEDRGLIVVYRGDGTHQRFGNLTGYVSGVRRYLDARGVPASKMDVVLSEGKNFFNEEYWIISKDVSPPIIAEAKFDWQQLRTPYHFSVACFKCEPSYPDLTTGQPDFEQFAAVLKTNTSLRGFVTVNNSAEAVQVRNALTRSMGLPRSRFVIKIHRAVKGSASDAVDLYLIPNGVITTAPIS